MEPRFFIGLRNALAICVPFWAAFITSLVLWPLATAYVVASIGLAAGFALSVRLTYDGLRGIARRMA